MPPLVQSLPSPPREMLPHSKGNSHALSLEDSSHAHTPQIVQEGSYILPLVIIGSMITLMFCMCRQYRLRHMALSKVRVQVVVAPKDEDLLPTTGGGPSGKYSSKDALGHPQPSPAVLEGVEGGAERIPRRKSRSGSQADIKSTATLQGEAGAERIPRRKSRSGSRADIKPPAEGGVGEADPSRRKSRSDSQSDIMSGRATPHTQSQEGRVLAQRLAG